jgi:hypothetical protein
MIYCLMTAHKETQRDTPYHSGMGIDNQYYGAGDQSYTPFLLKLERSHLIALG